MKLNMMVVMTTWLPRLACSQPGMKAQKPPTAAAGEHGQRERSPPGQELQLQRHDDDAEPGDVGLPVAADVEQAGMRRRPPRQGR
jgi:hypothetical protein